MMTENLSHKKLMIIAGEVSGDIHGGRLMAALKARAPDLEFLGIGGDRMIGEGLVPSYHIREMAFLGLVEVLKHLPFIRKVFNELYALAESNRPDAIILIDYPGFNLRFAKKIKKLGIPVIYYISPQLWAWGKKRVYKVKKYISRMLVIFPFEKSFYAGYQIEADYVGHPLVDSHYNAVNPRIMDERNKVLGLLPGSRSQELENLLPDMVRTAKLLKKSGHIGSAIILKVNTISPEVYQALTGRESFIHIYEGEVAGFYNQIDAALVSSGTATLETAYFKVPLVIVYRVSQLTWLLGNMFVNLDTIGLANIVAGKKVAQELLQHHFTPETAAAELEILLIKDKNLRKREELGIIHEKLGPPGASERAARLIIEFIS